MRHVGIYMQHDVFDILNFASDGSTAEVFKSHDYRIVCRCADAEILSVLAISTPCSRRDCSIS